MSPLPNPVANRIIFKQSWSPMDPDAAAYIAAVETADGQELEEKVKIAIDNFVLGCKADGIWSAIKASCILAGARTLNGALVPLVGTAPTNNNFVSGDYNRKTGLVGDGSTKYLNSNRANNADPQNDKHLAAYTSELPSASTNPIIGMNRNSGAGAGFIYNTITRLNDSASSGYVQIAGFTGISRNGASGYTRRTGSSSSTVVVSSVTPLTGSHEVFSEHGSGVGGSDFSDARIAFYSIGESLNLALLDARVTDLINAFSSVIP